MVEREALHRRLEDDASERPRVLVDGADGRSFETGSIGRIEGIHESPLHAREIREERVF